MIEMAAELHNELQRVHRVSDMLCSGHASLATRYRFRALLLDLSILALSTWLVSLAFIEPTINVSLTPFHLDPRIWSGLLAICTLLLSIVQITVDWKGRSDAHKRAANVYSEVHREAGYLLASRQNITEESCRRVLSRYDLATNVGVTMPERDFLPQKRRHQTKIAISRHLDSHPSASIAMTRIRFWWRDNFGSGDRQRQ